LSDVQQAAPNEMLNTDLLGYIGDIPALLLLSGSGFLLPEVRNRKDGIGPF